MKQLPKVAVGLEDSWPLGALNALFPLQDYPLQQGAEDDHSGDLADLQQYVAHHGAPPVWRLPPGRGNPGATVRHGTTKSFFLNDGLVGIISRWPAVFWQEECHLLGNRIYGKAV
jgi:hypothetical protein